EIEGDKIRYLNVSIVWPFPMEFYSRGFSEPTLVLRSCSCPEARRREASRRRDWAGRHGLVVTFGAWPASLQARARPVSQPSAPAFSLLLADENSLRQLKADSECNSHNPDYVLAQQRASRNLLAPTARTSAPAANSAAPPENEKPNSNVRLKSRPPCSVARRGLARRAGSVGPAARRTTRRRPRSHRPDARPCSRKSLRQRP